MAKHYTSVLVAALLLLPGSATAQTYIGKCIRPDCTAMRTYCEQGNGRGKTGTNCTLAAARCLKTQRWVGRTTNGKRWSCTF